VHFQSTAKAKTSNQLIFLMLRRIQNKHKIPLIPPKHCSH